MAPGDEAKPKSPGPVWCAGLVWSALSVDYLTALADRARPQQGPLLGQEMAAAFSVDAVPPWAEGLRSKAKRPVARGWPTEQQPVRFTLAAGVTGPGEGS